GAGSQDNLSVFLAAKFLYGAHFLHPIPDLARTTHLFIVGTNPVVSQGTLAHVTNVKARLRDIRARGGKLVVIDPRRPRTPELADEPPFAPPDSVVFLFRALLHTIFAEGRGARGSIASHPAAAARLRDVVRASPREMAAEQRAIPAD